MTWSNSGPTIQGWDVTMSADGNNIVVFDYFNGYHLSANGGAIWIKRRIGGSGSYNDNWIFDSVRGVSQGLRTNQTSGTFDISGFSFPFSTSGFTVPNYVPFNESCFF